MMHQSTNQPEPSGTSPLRALEYETPPPPPPPRERSIWVGVAGALFLSGGFGFATGGILVAARMDDELAVCVGFGVGCISFGTILLLMFTRKL